MNLGQLRFVLRRGLGSLNPATSLWSNAELNDLLNEAAQVLCSEAECFQRCIKQATTAGMPEYQLPSECNKIIDVKFLQGSLFEMDAINPWDAQGNVQLIGMPERYYIKNGIAELSPQINGNDVVPQPLPLPGNMPAKSLGLYPCPGSAGPLTVWFYARHPWMANDGAEPQIPVEFHRGLVEYAKAFCMESQGALNESDRAIKKYSDFKERLKEVNSFNMNAQGGLKMEYRRNAPMGEGWGTQWIYVGDAS